MRLKFHGSLEALRDTVTLRRDKAHHKEDAGNLGVHNTSRSSRTSNHSRRSSRSTSVPDLSISDSETDVREKQLSVASIGEEVSDSVPELQDSALAGGGTGRGKGYNKGPLRADASALEGMVLDEHLAEAVRGGSGGIASFIQKAVSSGANQPQRGASFKYSVFFRPGAFNTDDSLKPGDGEDGTTHDDARSSTSGSPAVTTDKTLEHTELDDHPSMRRHMQGPQTFQMSSILVGADDGEDFRDVLPITIEEHSEESVVVTTPNVAITPVTPIAPSPGKLNTINHIHSLQASGSCATLGATSHLGSTDSLQMPTLSGRPSFVSIDSLNSLSGSAYSSRWRLDSTGSRMSSARASSGSVGRKVERPPLGPFWTNERVIRDLASKLDEELFSLLDIRPHSGEAGHAGSGPGVVLDSATPATVVTEVVDGKPQIASGTLPELVSSLASEGANDAEYLIDFLNTYRYFADAEDVARLLVWRYIDIGERATSTGKGAEWAGFLQLRVLNVFKKWTELHPLDFGQSDMLQHILTVFLQQHVSKDEKRAMFASALMKNLQERVSTVRTGSSSGSLGGSHSESFLFSPKPIAVERNRRPSAPPTTLSRALSPHVALDGSGGVRSGRRKSGLMIMSSPFGSLTAIDGGLPPLPQFPSPNQSHLRSSSAPPVPASVMDEKEPSPPCLTDFDPLSVAQQLTVIEHGYFKQIQMRELFHQAWNDRNTKHVAAPNLTHFITWFNRVAYGVATDVVLTAKIKHRVMMLKRYIYIAQACYKVNNFNTVFEIVAGLNLGPVTRLKRTWKALPKKYWDVWVQLNSIVSNENSYKVYRSALQHAQAKCGSSPILPYLGVNLSDLTFTEDGNPSFLIPPPVQTGQLHGPSLPIINFTKFRLLSSLFRTVMALQRSEYVGKWYGQEFTVKNEIVNFIKNEWYVMDDAELYECSRGVEPRIPVG